MAGRIWWLISHQNVAYFDKKFGLNWLIFVRYFVRYILNSCELRERLKGPSKPKRTKISACGRHLYYFEFELSKREAEGALSKPKWTKNFCLRQALIML